MEILDYCIMTSIIGYKMTRSLKDDYVDSLKKNVVVIWLSSSLVSFISFICDE